MHNPPQTLDEALQEMLARLEFVSGRLGVGEGDVDTGELLFLQELSNKGDQRDTNGSQRLAGICMSVKESESTSVSDAKDLNYPGNVCRCITIGNYPYLVHSLRFPRFAKDAAQRGSLGNVCHTGRHSCVAPTNLEKST